jgi:hypothetical protein
MKQDELSAKEIDHRAKTSQDSREIQDLNHTVTAGRFIIMIVIVTRTA